MWVQIVNNSEVRVGHDVVVVRVLGNDAYPHLLGQGVPRVKIGGRVRLDSIVAENTVPGDLIPVGAIVIQPRIVP